ncbi:IS21 family transposase [Thermodesulfovibrionales bacterium]|nr:IS21 family transposase [Thermodesulfovibrionales bacterium]
MAKKKKRRTAMRKARDVLRLHFGSRLSNQQIADALRISKTNVFNTLSRFQESEMTWPIPNDLSDTELEARIYSVKPDEKGGILPDFEYMHEELTRPHMTLELLWNEYSENNPKGLSRSSFYRHYQKYRKGPSISMKIIHKGGDKVFVDYSGGGLRYYNRETGKWVETEFFVSSWGASSYSYAECTESQSGQNWVRAHIRALEYFRCVPNALVPDNLKSGVTKASFYEPDINALYDKFARHYDTAILPARVRKPKDKPVVESNILHLQRFIFGRLRNHTFFSLAELNKAMWELLELYNDRPMQQYKKSRKERFELLDKPYAKPLPSNPFLFTQVKIDVRVAPSYHIEFDRYYYSVPYELVQKLVDVYQINNILEIYHDGKHICRHKKGPPNYRYTTKDEHMPSNHKFVKGWSAPWFIAQAHKIGTATAELVSRVMQNRKHPEQGFRTAMGLLNLSKKYPKQRVEKAAERALYFGNLTCKAMKAILDQGLEEKTVSRNQNKEAVLHENIRGQEYYNH